MSVKLIIEANLPEEAFEPLLKFLITFNKAYEDSEISINAVSHQSTLEMQRIMERLELDAVTLKKH